MNVHKIKNIPGSAMGTFSFQGKIPLVTMVWVVSRFRLTTPPGISSSCISALTSSGQRSRASWASQPQKSATLSPQPGWKPRKFIRTCGGIGRKKYIVDSDCRITTLPERVVAFPMQQRATILLNQYIA